MSKDSSSKIESALASSYRLAMPVFVCLSVVFIYLAGNIFGILFLSLIFSFAGMSPADISIAFNANIVAKFLASLFVGLSSVGMVFGFLKYINENPFKYLKISNRPNIKALKVVATAYLLYFVSFIIVSTVGDLLVSGLDVDQKQQLGFSTDLVGIEYFWVFLTLVILPPIVEEIIFRGFLYKLLKNTVSIKVSVIITSLLFAVVHLEFFGSSSLNWIAAIDTFVLSLFLIWVYERTKNLWSSIILHGLKNLVAFTVLFLV